MEIKSVEEGNRLLEEWMNEYKTIESHQQKLISSQKGLIAQYQENDLVMKELEILSEEEEVFRLVGPSLLKISPDEAKGTVQQRLDRFKSEIEKISKQHQEKVQEQEKLKEKAAHVQKKLGELESVKN